MICIEDREAKSWTETNFFVMDTSKLNFPENLKEYANEFINLANESGLICPTIKIYINKINIKYDNDDKYVVFTLRQGYIEYVFGRLGHIPKTGTIGNCVKKQLQSFNRYIYT